MSAPARRSRTWSSPPVGSDGKVDFYFGAPSGSVNLVADVSGYYAPGSTSYVTTVTSAQMLWNSYYQFATNPSSYTEYFTRYFDFSIPALSQNIINNGTVQIYFTPDNSDSPNNWEPLPYTFTDGSGNFDYEFAPTTTVGQVQINAFFVQRNMTATIPTLSSFTFATFKVKVVLTPSTPPSSLPIS